MIIVFVIIVLSVVIICQSYLIFAKMQEDKFSSRYAYSPEPPKYVVSEPPKYVVSEPPKTASTEIIIREPPKTVPKEITSKPSTEETLRYRGRGQIDTVGLLRWVGYLQPHIRQVRIQQVRIPHIRQVRIQQVRIPHTQYRGVHYDGVDHFGNPRYVGLF